MSLYCYNSTSSRSLSPRAEAAPAQPERPLLRVPAGGTPLDPHRVRDRRGSGQPVEKDSGASVTGLEPFLSQAVQGAAYLGQAVVFLYKAMLDDWRKTAFPERDLGSALRQRCRKVLKPIQNGRQPCKPIGPVQQALIALRNSWTLVLCVWWDSA